MYTFIIAIIGCITGCISLFINIKQFFIDYRAPKVITYAEENLFFSRVIHNYRTTYQGIVHVKIVNPSIYATTIHSICILCNGQELPVRKYPDSENSFLTLNSKDNIPYLRFDLSDSFDIPLEIKSGSCYNGHVFLPFFPDTNQTRIPIKLVLYTSRHKTKKSTYISKWNPEEPPMIMP